MIILSCSQKNKLKFRIKYFAGQTVIDIVHIIISSNLPFIILQSWALAMPTSHVFRYHPHLFSFVFRSRRCKVAKVWVPGLSLSWSRASAVSSSSSLLGLRSKIKGKQLWISIALFSLNRRLPENAAVFFILIVSFVHVLILFLIIKYQTGCFSRKGFDYLL